MGLGHLEVAPVNLFVLILIFGFVRLVFRLTFSQRPNHGAPPGAEEAERGPAAPKASLTITPPVPIMASRTKPAMPWSPMAPTPTLAVRASAVPVWQARAEPRRALSGLWPQVHGAPDTVLC